MPSMLEEIKKNKKIFFTFGDGSTSLRASSKRLINQVEKLKIFDTIIRADLNFIKKNCYKKYFNNKNILNKKTKGFGYWIWKSILLDWILKSYAKNSIIMYADCGCEAYKDGYKNFLYYLTQCYKYGAVFFKLPYHEAEWTKMDLLKHKKINIKNVDSHNHVQATFFLIKNIKKNRELVSEWYDISCQDNYHFLDDSASVKKNHNDFIGHRHDQSILSCLVFKKKINANAYGYSFDPLLLNYNNSPFKRFFIHSLRNKKGKTLLKCNKFEKSVPKIYLELYFFLKKIFFIFKVNVTKNMLLRKVFFRKYRN
jgi:hypothetical protein